MIIRYLIFDQIFFLDLDNFGHHLFDMIQSKKYIKKFWNFFPHNHIEQVVLSMIQIQWSFAPSPDRRL